jgi:hypothetical protein
MLEIALQFLKNELNSYIKLQTGSSADAVNLSPVVDETGKYAIHSETVRLFPHLRDNHLGQSCRYKNYRFV